MDLRGNEMHLCFGRRFMETLPFMICDPFDLDQDRFTIDNCFVTPAVE